MDILKIKSTIWCTELKNTGLNKNSNMTTSAIAVFVLNNPCYYGILILQQDLVPYNQSLIARGRDHVKESVTDSRCFVGLVFEFLPILL